MASEALIKNSLIIFVVLFFALISFSAEDKPIKEIDVLYMKIVAPGSARVSN
jgi:hypothetical protein